ncbi:MAG TPA: polymer-forming cytoskeletal protein [Dehalococcoidia bacterium]|nr:polymer-forming cytoskeletal protein [Dehalococcoidia bacterium]
MFRRRKEPGSGGYDRISRLLEDRRRELDEADDEEPLSSDTIDFSHGEPPAAEDDGVSLLEARSPFRTAPDSAEEDVPEVERTLPSRWNSPPPLDEEEELPRPAEPYQAAAAQPEHAAPDPMRVPDIGRASASVTLVAVEASWEGKLHSDGDVRIEGTVRGEVVSAATLVIAPHARVHASIRARNIMLAGDVEGDITCDERLEILPGGSARGQINSAKLVVHEGAYIDSRFQMRREGGA